MNFILICRGTRATRHWALSHLVIGGVTAALVMLIGGSFALGVTAARAGTSGSGEERIGALSADLARPRQSISGARDAAQGQLDAMAIRLGELNAHVIRLNALGARLTRMAKLDDGEFDFSVPPAIGGPEESASAAVDVSDLSASFASLDQTLAGQEQQLSVLADLLVDRKLQEDVRPRGRPVRAGFISSFFGVRTDPFTGHAMTHRGIDFAAKSGTEVVAVATGVVTWSGERAGYGRLVEVVHGNGYVTRYAHNAQNLVAVGDHVEQGQTIALMGATGRATGPNLHFEVWYQGRPVNPARFVQHAS